MRCYNQEEKQDIVSMYKQGISIKKIAQKYSRSENGIRYLLKQLGEYNPQNIPCYEKYIGKKYNKITIKSFDHWMSLPRGDKIPIMRCCCDCGNENFLCNLYSIKRGTTRSCGCLRNSVPNKYDLDTYNYGIGYLSNGEIFYFDLEDYEKIKSYHWVNGSQGYVCAHIINNGIKTSLRLHRLIMGVENQSQDIIVDHINQNIKDNRKDNLRLSNKTLNGINRGANKNNKIGLKGVQKSGNKYWAFIYYDGYSHRIGTYDTPEEAYEARVAFENNMYGDYSYENSKKIGEKINGK